MMLETGNLDDADANTRDTIDTADTDMTKYTLPTRDARRGTTTRKLVELHNTFTALQDEDNGDDGDDDDEDITGNELARRQAQYKAQRKLAKQQRRRCRQQFLSAIMPPWSL